MATATRLITAEEFYEMDLPGKELVRGVIVSKRPENPLVAPPGFEHGVRANRIAVLITLHADKHKLGYVSQEGGVKLSDSPDTVRGPDVSFITASRLAGRELPSGFLEEAPDLAVKVISPNDRLVDVEEKVDEYLAAGVRLIWVVNSRRQTITIYTPDVPPRLLNRGDMLEGEAVLPGFSIRVSEAFI